MKRKLFVLCLFVIGLSLFAAPGNPPSYGINNGTSFGVGSGDIYVVVQKEISVDGFTYPWTVDGLRMFVDDLQFGDLVIYDRINLMMTELEEELYTSVLIGASVGGTALLTGVGLLAYDLFTDRFAADESNLAVGVGLTIGGVFFYVIYTIFSTSDLESDMYKIVNTYNRLAPDKKAQVGFDDGNGNPGLYVCLSF